MTNNSLNQKYHLGVFAKVLTFLNGGCSLIWVSLPSLQKSVKSSHLTTWLSDENIVQESPRLLRVAGHPK